MKASTYHTEAVNEKNHWWFAGRRKLFAREIHKAGISEDWKVLDVGTSTGTNLRMLRDYGFKDYSGLDLSEHAIEYCRKKGLGDVLKGDICNIPFADDTFDFVLATDIIEHVEDDGKAIQELGRILRPGGLCLVTVPAFEILWGQQDEDSHHQRRYRMRQLVNLVEGTAFEVVRKYYFNYILFFPILVVRKIMILAKLESVSENEMNSPLINRIFTSIFTFDIRTAPTIRPPFGVSILLLLRKR